MVKRKLPILLFLAIAFLGSCGYAQDVAAASSPAAASDDADSATIVLFAPHNRISDAYKLAILDGGDDCLGYISGGCFCEIRKKSGAISLRVALLGLPTTLGMKHYNLSERLELHVNAGETLYIELLYLELESRPHFMYPLALELRDAARFEEAHAFLSVSDVQSAEYVEDNYTKSKDSLFVRAGYFIYDLSNFDEPTPNLTALTAGVGWLSSGGLQIEADLIQGFASLETLLGASIGYQFPPNLPDLPFFGDLGLGVFTTLVLPDSGKLASHGFLQWENPYILPFVYSDFGFCFAKSGRPVVGIDLRTWFMATRRLKLDPAVEANPIMVIIALGMLFRMDLGFHWYF